MSEGSREMNEINEIFEVEFSENYKCEDCGETVRLQFGVCLDCGGDVIDKEEDE